MNKFVNEPNQIVADFLRGLALSHPQLRVDLVNGVVYRRTPKVGKVALLSGGGSGHEPLHSGFVGEGMLDAACVGQVFTSPTPRQIVAAVKEVDVGAGVLLIVKNYTGDRMNFEIAAERASRSGIDVKWVLIDDDIVGGHTLSDGRRGLGLTVLAEKILGSAAECGMSLNELYELGQRLRRDGRSMGIALNSCVHPGTGEPTFDIGSDEIEIGIGIHGEAGWSRSKLMSAHDTASLLVTSVLEELEPADNSSFITLVNGMGGTPELELYIMAGEVNQKLASLGHRVSRHLVGSYITSLEMAGCSLTLLRAHDEYLEHWDAPVTTPSWRSGVAA